MEDVKVMAATALCLMSLYNYATVLQRCKLEVVPSRPVKKRRRRQKWMAAIHCNRTIFDMANYYEKPICEGLEEFTKDCRISRTDFEYLLNKIEPMIKKRTLLRVPIPPALRLVITLRYLATGDSYRRLHSDFKVSTPAISAIVPQVCRALNAVLRDQIRIPPTPDHWLAIEEGFRETFPKCVGAIDMKHLVVRCPTRSGSEHGNNKGKNSLVLMTLIDSDYRFIYAEIGGEGRGSDEEYLKHSLLWQSVCTNTINLPPNTPLPGKGAPVPYVFLGDWDFLLHKHVMTPFPGNHEIGSKERAFNDRLSSTRAIVDNVFGVLTSVFGVLKKPMEIDREKVPLVTKTCILLHNFLRESKYSRNIYTPPGTFDSVDNGEFIEGTWRQSHPGSSALRPILREAKRTKSDISEIKHEFADFFHSVNLI